MSINLLYKALPVSISQKTQYALRALLELSVAKGTGPIKVHAIASAQHIPPRFLQIILNELKQVGLVDSRRGAAGGYVLAVRPDELSVGDVIRRLEGDFDPVGCIDDPSEATCPQVRSCVFVPVFRRVRDAVSAIYDNTSFEDLADEKRAREALFVPNFAI